MGVLCVDCNNTKQQSKELRVITKANQLSIYIRLHPTHSIQVIESNDLDRYGFKIRSEPDRHHHYRYPCGNTNLLGELYEQSK